jgi:hypothetical protein
LDCPFRGGLDDRPPVVARQKKCPRWPQLITRIADGERALRRDTSMTCSEPRGGEASHFLANFVAL